MRPRQLAVTPQAQRDLAAIIAWYRRELGALAASKAARSIQAGIRAAARIELSRARREDLPEGYFRVVARAHLIIFKVEQNTGKIVRILHGARDIATLLENPGKAKYVRLCPLRHRHRPLCAGLGAAWRHRRATA